MNNSSYNNMIAVSDVFWRGLERNDNLLTRKLSFILIVGWEICIFQRWGPQ